jgi:hypothetical protein
MMHARARGPIGLKGPETGTNPPSTIDDGLVAASHVMYNDGVTNRNR